MDVMFPNWENHLEKGCRLIKPGIKRPMQDS